MVGMKGQRALIECIWSRQSAYNDAETWLEEKAELAELRKKVSSASLFATPEPQV